MKIIEWLSDKIADEISDARCYIKKALMLKTDYPRLADVLSRISEEEMKHMALLHNEVVDIIEEYRKEKGEPPEPMMAVYEYLHKKQIDGGAEVKAMQTMYKT